MPGKFAHPTSSCPKYLNLFSLEKPYSPFIYVLPLLPRVAVASMCSSGCSVQRASASQLAARARGTRHVMLGLHIIIFFLNLVRLLTSLTHLHALTSSSSPLPRQFRPRLYGSAHGMDSLRMVQRSCCGITWRGVWVTWQCWATFKTHRASGKYSLSSSLPFFPRPLKTSTKHYTIATVDIQTDLPTVDRRHAYRGGELQGTSQGLWLKI